MLTAFFTRRLEDAAFVTARYPRVRSIAQGAVAALAGLAVSFRPLPVAAACCVAPYGGGECLPWHCQGAVCAGSCIFYVGLCPGRDGACWQSWVSGCAGTCCDCYCYDEGTSYSWFCYCYY
jgi:hypothetical protein